MKRLLKRVVTTGIGLGALVTASLTAGQVAGATSGITGDMANPSFESPVITTSYYNFPAPSTAIDGWTVTAGDVDLVMAPYAVHDGTQALDLNGFGPGTIQQTFAVHPGLHYSIKYWVNTNGGNLWTIDVVSDGVSLIGGPATGDYANPPGAVVFDGSWQQWGPPDVVPAGNTMTVTLTSLQTTGAGGVILDDFAVTYTDHGPNVSDLAVAPAGAKVHLTGTVANGATGQGDVTGAQYRLTRGTYVGPWVPMAATDGAFDEPSEGVFADIALPAQVGSYNIDVRGVDELGYYTDSYGHLTNAFTVNVVASGPIVANTAKSATINSAADKSTPDFVVDSIAGMVGGVPVGYVNINYKALAPVHFLPGGSTPFVFYYGYDSVDLGAWHSDEVSPTSIQFMNDGGLAGYPRGGFWMNFATSSAYAIPASTVPSWAPGVPFDRGGVTVWPIS